MPHHLVRLFWHAVADNGHAKPSSTHAASYTKLEMSPEAAAVPKGFESMACHDGIGCSVKAVCTQAERVYAYTHLLCLILHT
jgi:hypothetical protein